MTIGMLFWIIMILLLLFGVGWGYRTDRTGGFVSFAPIGSFFIFYVLIFLLGWKVFGFVIQS